MERVSLEQAYPGIPFRVRTRNWWARLTRVPPECVHLETEQRWMATLVPDAVYLRGKPVVQRRPERPEVSLCRDCLAAWLAGELRRHPGRVVAFEPDAASFSQYFFLDADDFAAAGLEVAVAGAVHRRLVELAGNCESCSEAATWLWIPRDEVKSLDEVDGIARARGRCLCPRHGPQALCACLGEIEEANLLYLNLPYGEAGAYLWI
jgi:hypothetical protein